MADITAMHLEPFGRHMCLVDRNSVTLKHTTHLMKERHHGSEVITKNYSANTD